MYLRRCPILPEVENQATPGTRRVRRHRTEEQFLATLRREGARRVRTVRFRANRSTIWSLTQGGTALNLHAGYRGAPLSVVRAFAVIVNEAFRRSPAYHSAAEVVREWPGLRPAIRREHARWERRTGRRRSPLDPSPCCGTPAQQRYLRRLYRYLNRSRFDGCLPDDIPVRFSDRMTSRLGQMIPGLKNGVPCVVEIALNVDLLLEGNGRERLDTLVHEMAHAAAYLYDGDRGHGEAWQAWARHARCSPTACSTNRIRRRRRRSQPVTRVPPLPAAIRQPAQLSLFEPDREGALRPVGRKKKSGRTFGKDGKDPAGRSTGRTKAGKGRGRS